ncbi:hypothetical protein ACSSV4_000890 [Roseovarius sp. MBR-154]
MQEVSLGNPISLIPNGSFKAGDAVGWTLDTAKMSVVARDPGAASVLALAPTGHVLRMDRDDAFNRDAVAVTGVEVQQGDIVDASITAGRDATGAGGIVALQFRWRDAAGVIITSELLGATMVSGKFQTSELTATAPADAATLDIILRRPPGGAGPVYVTQVIAERQSLSARQIAASVDTIESTKVDADGAVAAVQQRISAEYASFEALAEATAFAEATADGIAAGFVWRLNGQNVLEAVSVADGTSGPTSTFRIAADFVQITGITQIDTAVIGQLAAENAFVSNLTVDTLNLAGEAVTTDKIKANGVTDFAIAGSGNVTNGNSTWTTAAEFTIDANAAAHALLGTIVLTLSHPPETFPAGFKIRATINVTTEVLSLTRDEMILATGGGARFVGSLSRAFTGASATVRLQIRNAGGQGLSSSNIWGMLVKK